MRKLHSINRPIRNVRSMNQPMRKLDCIFEPIRKLKFSFEPMKTLDLNFKQLKYRKTFPSLQKAVRVFGRPRRLSESTEYLKHFCRIVLYKKNAACARFRTQMNGLADPVLELSSFRIEQFTSCFSYQKVDNVHGEHKQIGPPLHSHHGSITEISS